ncbi:N6-adenine-specific DNA methyltransferase 2 [Loa loa]|uniref:Protein-lysine N-methyltransferase LOAG_01445 n=1 Tax=Loa loa TaxID=7209 RepID=A0A1I7VM16_LOALO|nr:N6-adenine-specific DNA methyltransferase 2 [Loa loa]EFO27047.2 N6-adenine-specific DNA methyltransferase 2 [Loa loa]
MSTERKFDDDNDSDDTPRLSAEAVNALAEFYIEMNAADKAVVEEDWQLSQFWYSEETASKLAEECMKSIGSCGRIACISCPTLLDYLLKIDCVICERVLVTLFEYDRRFERKFAKEFVAYDYREPLAIPEFHHNAFDLIVIDPPFLSDECLIKVAQTVRLLSRESSTKLLICTGLIMAKLVERLFHAHKCKFQPCHKHNLANEFACYANYETVVL